MNTPGSPLSPETLDELLSAELDGELERAAADLGLTLEEAMALMHAAPDAPRRRAELTRARDVLAVPIPLAPARELHLVAGALRAPVDEIRAARERPLRAWRVLVAVGSAAAVIAGVVALAHSHPAGEAKSASSASLASPAPQRLPPVTAPQHSVQFGDVSRPATLRAVLESRLTIHASHAAVAANGTSLQGVTGSQGLVSVAGAQGATALVGPQGLQGDEGIQGPVGPTGPQGPAPTGPTGPTGPQGVTGPVGLAGPLGGTGVQGGIGPQGPSGAAGVSGAPDEGLAFGAIGEIGPLVANDRLELMGPQGVTGGNAPVQAAAAPAVTRVAAGVVTKNAESAPAGSNAERTCTTAVQDSVQLGSAPVLSGTGTDNRRPVVIAVFRRGPDYVAYVLSASDCAVLSQQTLP